jgi:hypothetical protein
MTDNNVIKFGKARKSLARVNKQKKAAENRARHGLKKSEKNKRAELAKRMQDTLDAHRRDPKPDDIADD